MSKGKKEEEDQKKICFDKIENAMRAVGVCVGHVKNRDEWWFRTKVADLK